MSGLPQLCHHACNACEGRLEGGQVCQLGPDMHINAGDLDPRQLGCTRIDARCLFPGNAELVFGFAGGDFLVGSGIHVRVDAQGNGGLFVQARCDL